MTGGGAAIADGGLFWSMPQPVVAAPAMSIGFAAGPSGEAGALFIVSTVSSEVAAARFSIDAGWGPTQTATITGPIFNRDAQAAISGDGQAAVVTWYSGNDVSFLRWRAATGWDSVVTAPVRMGCGTGSSGVSAPSNGLTFGGTSTSAIAIDGAGEGDYAFSCGFELRSVRFGGGALSVSAVQTLAPEIYSAFLAVAANGNRFIVSTQGTFPMREVRGYTATRAAPTWVASSPLFSNMQDIGVGRASFSPTGDFLGLGTVSSVNVSTSRSTDRFFAVTNIAGVWAVSGVTQPIVTASYTGSDPSDVTYEGQPVLVGAVPVVAFTERRGFGTVTTSVEVFRGPGPWVQLPTPTPSPTFPVVLRQASSIPSTGDLFLSWSDSFATCRQDRGSPLSGGWTRFQPVASFACGELTHFADGRAIAIEARSSLVGMNFRSTLWFSTLSR